MVYLYNLTYSCISITSCLFTPFAVLLDVANEVLNEIVGYTVYYIWCYPVPFEELYSCTLVIAIVRLATNCSFWLDSVVHLVQYIGTCKHTLHLLLVLVCFNTEHTINYGNTCPVLAEMPIILQ